MESHGQIHTGRSARDFYEKALQGNQYASLDSPESHPYYERLLRFVEGNRLRNQPCLEIGSGRGMFQSLSNSYFGMDIALASGRNMTTPFVAASAESIPFPHNHFAGLWTITVLEHVPNPEACLEEMWRVLRPGGVLFLAPAWQCRSWAAEGYPVRPYSDFGLRGKLIKASIPVRDTIIYRSLGLIPRRLIRLIRYLTQRRPTRFRYRKLDANFDIFWMSDSDAINSMDPFDAYLWFLSRGAECLNYPSMREAFLMRTGVLEFRKPREAE